MSSVVPINITIRSGSYEDASALGVFLIKLAEETPFTLMTPVEQKAATLQQALYTQYVLRSAHQAIFVAAHRTGQIAGCINLSHGGAERNRHVCTLAMGVLKDFWGTGLAAELVARGVDWARQKGVNRYEVTVDERNDRAIRFYEKQGFVREGLRRRSLCANGAWVNEIYLGRLDG